MHVTYMYNVSKCPGCVFPSTPVCWQHRAAFSHWPQHVRAQQVNTVSTFLSLHLLVIPQLTPFLFLSTCTYKWRQIDTFLSGGKQQPFMRPPIVHCRAALPMAEVPDNEKWKLGELDNLLLGERVGLEKEGQDVKRVVSMFMLCL